VFSCSEFQGWQPLLVLIKDPVGWALRNKH
jgi:hypothetical protein